jgi:hypothetical protein
MLALLACFMRRTTAGGCWTAFFGDVKTAFPTCSSLPADRRSVSTATDDDRAAARQDAAGVALKASYRTRVRLFQETPAEVVTRHGWTRCKTDPWWCRHTSGRHSACPCSRLNKSSASDALADSVRRSIDSEMKVTWGRPLRRGGGWIRYLGEVDRARHLLVQVHLHFIGRPAC